ncbi:MAG: hypothetical protein JWP75_3679 [Frondihabitans sp.]|nr:hypothetical protein [Frondihabitans sp.]
MTEIVIVSTSRFPLAESAQTRGSVPVTGSLAATDELPTGRNSPVATLH